MSARDANNFLRILDAPGDVENYFLSNVDGQEALSEPFHFTLHLRARGEVPDPGGWIGASVTFGMGASDGDMRRINGQCVRFEQSYQRDNYVEFEIDVAPAFVSAQQRRNCRIFEDVTALEIIEQILTEYEMDFNTSNVNFVDFVREYCVQYWETDFDFCCRLMEEEGIFYYFLYDEGAGQYQHRMYLADNEAGYFDGAIYEISFPEDASHQGIISIDLQHMQYTNAWITHDYNYKSPSSLTPVTTSTRFDYSAPGTATYEWPGGYDAMDIGQRASRFGMQLAEAASVIMSGEGTYMCFMPGARFDITDKRLQPAERMIALRSVSHSSHNPANASEGEFFYKQSFTAVPSTEPFHPPRVTPRARVQGPQTAVVVDQEDPEGYGRIKVRFHWNLDEDPTCWLRVAQQWAGDQIGALWTPRIGWEVLVVFLEGDPDRPVIAGGLYNADDMPPFTLPAKLSQSGWRTRTWPTGQVVNELIFEDADGGEEIYLYAGRNYRREIVDDETATIGGFRTTKVGKDQSLDVDGKSTTKIGKSDELTVGDDQTIKIGGDSKTTIDKDETVDVTGDSTTTVTGDNSLEVKGSSDTTVKKDAEVKVSGDLKITVKGDISLDGAGGATITSTGELSIESKTKLTLRVGGSQIEISAAGVMISGDLVTITGALVKIN